LSPRVPGHRRMAWVCKAWVRGFGKEVGGPGGEVTTQAPPCSAGAEGLAEISLKVGLW
jgi:hypothetical protein